MTLIMSVSGVRGIVGETLTPALVAELGVAFASHLGGGTIVVGRDSRPSGPVLLRCLTAGLRACGCDVIDLGVVSTPGTALMILERRAGGGVVITASHNPSPWNGIKFLTAEGFAPPPEAARLIFDRHRQGNFDSVDGERIGSLQTDATTHERHVARVLDVIEPDVIRGRGFTVVLDSVNGAGGPGGRLLLEKLGCRVVAINGEPTGRFAHTPEPIAENLTGLCDAVRQHQADIGFAQDPDADRLAIVDDTGRYIGEEYTVALAAKHVFAKRPGPAAVNLSTSRMIDDLAAQADEPITVYRTPVGEANVSRAVLDHGCVIGGEGNGGVIDPRVVPVRDSFTAMGLVLNLLAEDDRPLSAIVDAMPRYVMIKQKFELAREQIDAWLRCVRDNIGDGRLDDTDGLRIDWPEGWVHLRPSNTEPIARVIAEAADAQTAAALAKRIADVR